MMKTVSKVSLIASVAVLCACSGGKIEWVSTTFETPWQAQDTETVTSDPSEATLIVDPALVGQKVEGFGTAASELSWDSINILTQEEKDSIFKELFAPGVGASLVMARTPIGASDFAKEYYSYDDVDGDFALDHFSIERDENYLLPFLLSAKKANPSLKVWGSPWCPPSWMKVNKHYANSSTAPIARRMAEMRKRMAEMPQDIRATGGSTFGFNPMNLGDNGLSEDKQIREGTDAFNLTPEYLDAYARYFGKYVDAYKEKGIDIYMVMPQNEPNSAQWYPACTWTPDGLKKFISVLGPEMEKRGVEVWLGTIERADVNMWNQIVLDPSAGKYIKGMGFQWAGKDALPGLHEQFPELPCYQSEQECGNGANDWKGAMHSWDLLKEYFTKGVTGYFYWNTSLFEGESSSWGWNQNSLITVNREKKTFRYTPEYYVLKHASHYVKPGANFLLTEGTYEDAIAFVNPDGKVVVLAANQTEEAKPLTVSIKGKNHTFLLPAASLSTIVL